VAEELRLQQALGDRPAVDRQHGRARPGAERVDGAHHQLLARSGGPVTRTGLLDPASRTISLRRSSTAGDAPIRPRVGSSQVRILNTDSVRWESRKFAEKSRKIAAADLDINSKQRLRPALAA
jgi:hypothetical protein